MNLLDGFSALTSAFAKWGNSRTNLGNPQRDATAGTYSKSPLPLYRTETDSLYINSWLMRRVCDVVPGLATSTKGTIKPGGENVDLEVIKEINKEIFKPDRVTPSLNVARFFKVAQQNANRTGGAAIVIYFKDNDWSKPIDPENVPEIQELRVFDRWQIQPHWGNDFFTGKLEPDYYQFLSISGQPVTNSYIHSSRVLPFYGEPLPLNDTYSVTFGWRGDSVIRKIINEVLFLDTSSSSVSDKMQRFAVTLAKMENLIDNLGKTSATRNTYAVTPPRGQVSYEEKIRQRVGAIAEAYSNFNVLLFDKSKEDAEILELNFAGVKDNLEFFLKLAKCATGLPETLITSEYGGNLSSLNEGERGAVEQVVLMQRVEWECNLNTVIYYIKEQPKFKTRIKDRDWSWEWFPIWQASPKESAEVKKTDAETLDKFAQIEERLVRIEKQRQQLKLQGIEIDPILTTSEIRTSVFGGTEFGGTNIVLEEIEQTNNINQEETIEENTEENTEEPIKDAIAKKIISYKDFKIGAEFLPGDKRHGRDLKGLGYGHIQKHNGEDGMRLDCYFHESINTEDIDHDKPIFLISQVIDGEFDEYKVMLGWDTISEAEKAYKSVMPDELFGGIKEIENIEQWKIEDCARRINELI